METCGEKQITKKRAPELLADFEPERLAGYPPAERDARIRAFQEKVAAFGKYRGIRNPAIPCGRKAVIRIVRQLGGRYPP